jgi:predicted sulfurtransferase
MVKDKSVSPSDDWGAVKENAKSVANRSLPPVPSLTRDKDGNFPVSLVLFYQYIEPSWTDPEHKAALNYVINLAKTHTVMGRGRCAPEGLNCTLTGTPQGVRDFCYGLRKWNPAFNETDFKITDGVYYGKRFKALTIRKV